MSAFDAIVQLDVRTSAGLLTQMVERNPSVTWSEDARSRALDLLTLRNVLFSYVMNGLPTLRIINA